MTDNEVFITLIKHFLKDVKNKTFKQHLEFMISRLENKKAIDQEDHPRFLAIQFGYFDMFDLPIEKYREMVKEIHE